MNRQRSSTQERIDHQMEAASKALVARRYFDAERRCVEALQLAHHDGDWERMARVLLPLQEARRQKRDLAVDAGRVIVLDGDLPKPAEVRAGLYLLEPPRVGLDGRMLREMADRQEVPVIVVTREPATREGLWPVVSLGPMVLRTRVAPPAPRKAVAGRAAKKPAPAKPPPPIKPSIAWMLHAGEALGDSAIAEAIERARTPLARLEELYLRLQSHPDHEKLHQALEEACQEANRLSLSRARSALRHETEDLDSETGEFAED